MTEQDQPRKRTDAGVLWIALSAVLAASLLLPPPRRDGQIAHLPSFCPFYILTGLPCPGCGLTRSVVCLEHGLWRDAWHWHPLGGPVLLLFVLFWLRSGLYWLYGVTLLPLPPRISRTFNWGAAAALLVFGAARIGWLTIHHGRF